MLRNRELFLFVIIWMLTAHGWAQDQERLTAVKSSKSHSQGIVTVIDGKQYAAFEEYKMEKLQNRIRKKLMADLDQVQNISPSRWVRGLSPNILFDLQEDQIRGLIQEVALFQMRHAQTANKSSEMRQMQDMLKEFYSDKETAPMVNLDEKKIKTIYIPAK